MSELKRYGGCGCRLCERHYGEIPTLRSENERIRERLGHASKAVDHWCKWFEALEAQLIQGWHYGKVREGLLDIRAALHPSEEKPR